MARAGPGSCAASLSSGTAPVAPRERLDALGRVEVRK